MRTNTRNDLFLKALIFDKLLKTNLPTNMRSRVSFGSRGANVNTALQFAEEQTSS